MLELDLTALNDRFFDGMDVEQYQVLVENQPEEELDETQLWCRWRIQPGASDAVETGVKRTYQQLGTATLQIVLPKGTGVAQG